jgi:hypothetical protein
LPKTQGIVSAIKQTRFAIGLAVKGKVPPPFPPHVAADVDESRRLHDLVLEQGRRGWEGIVQGERALAKLAHGHGEDDRDPYGEGALRPYLPGEAPEPKGGDAGMGSLTQADATPGAEPTRKPEGGA